MNLTEAKQALDSVQAYVDGVRRALNAIGGVEMTLPPARNGAHIEVPREEPHIKLDPGAAILHALDTAVNPLGPKVIYEECVKLGIPRSIKHYKRISSALNYLYRHHRIHRNPEGEYSRKRTVGKAIVNGHVIRKVTDSKEESSTPTVVYVRDAFATATEPLTVNKVFHKAVEKGMPSTKTYKGRVAQMVYSWHRSNKIERKGDGFMMVPGKEAIV